MQFTTEEERFYSIFMQEALQRRIEAENAGMRFVHYTSVEAAFSMLKNSEVWLRKSNVMNDFREVEYGIECLAHAWNSNHGERFRGLLSEMFPGADEQLNGLLNTAVPPMRYDTFLTCISEHDTDEDYLGRLSMWRAYGGIALVLNPATFMSDTNALQVYSSPVSYLSAAEFLAQFEAMVHRVDHDRHFLKAQGADYVLQWILLAFRNAIISTKHPGFREEREWRVIYHPHAAENAFVSKEIELIRGIAQPVVKLHLHDDPQLGITALSPGNLIERIIIGPTPYAATLHEAFSTLLQSHGVADAHKRVVASDIPLRQPG